MAVFQSRGYPSGKPRTNRRRRPYPKAPLSARNRPAIDLQDSVPAAAAGVKRASEDTGVCSSSGRKLIRVVIANMEYPLTAVCLNGETATRANSRWRSELHDNRDVVSHADNRGLGASADNRHFCHHWRSFSAPAWVVAQIREHGTCIGHQLCVRGHYISRPSGSPQFSRVKENCGFTQCLNR